MLMNESGDLLAIQPVIISKQEAESELREALAEANQQNTKPNEQLADTA